jgi:hypothetical protein
MSDKAAPASPPSTPLPSTLSAGTFNSLLEAFERLRIPLATGETRATAEHQRDSLKLLIEGHITDAHWRGLMHKAREAAEHGKRECLLLRFPSDTCSDAGRALARQEPGWRNTLTGDAAAIYHRWQADLAPRGFVLTGRVLEYPDGKPGDAGLFLGWQG